MGWSEYQTRIFESLHNGQGNLVVEAYAGTGKTTTIVEGLKGTSPRSRPLAIAFNRSIAAELKNRVPQHVNVKTVSGAGKWALHRAFGEFPVVENRTDTFAREAVSARGWFTTDKDGKRRPRYVGSIVKLVSAAKSEGLGPEDIREVRALAIEKEMDNLTVTVDELTGAVCQVLEDCETFGGEIDFDDMAWLPYRLKLTPRSNGIVVVDEAQDLNEPQLYLAKAMARQGGRVVVVGDRHQAIYQFRGAGKGMFARLIEELGGELLKLPVTYRCSRAVVELARQQVPDFQAAPGAPDGSVTRLPIAKLLKTARPGDFIISRSNAPLVSLMKDAIRARIPAIIAGRDFGRTLEVFLDQLDAPDMKTLVRRIEEYRDRETRKAAELERPSLGERAVDKAEALLAFAEGVGSVAELRSQIGQYFTDEDARDRVVLTTTHKAKGLERDNVYVLEGTFGRGMAYEEGRNLWYVAITRARHNLILVEEPRQ